MSWNEPGGSGGRDPWGTRGQEQGPPDLEEVIKKLQDRLGGLFGGRRGGGGPGRFGAGGAKGLWIAVAVILGLVALSGFYIVDARELGVVLRLGRYVAPPTTPGLHWRIPFVDSVEVVDVAQVRSVEVGYRSGRAGQPSVAVPSEALMLTQDENIVDIEMAVQYRVKDAPEYLFNVRDPDGTLRNVTESAVREVIGKSQMDFVLTEGRQEIALRTGELMQQILDLYKTGLLVTSVNMQDAQPPDEVQAAFADAIKAREDEQRLKNEAEAYSNDILPKARGAAARQLEESNAYREQVVAEAEGETKRFLLLLAEYNKAGPITRERLYLDTMELVLGSTAKVLVDVTEGNNLLLLPLDQIFRSATGVGSGELSGADRQQGEAAIPEPSPLRDRLSLRTRRGR